MSALTIIPSPATPEQIAYLDAHSEITEAAPRWARQIKFDNLHVDGSADFHYWFVDDRVEVNEHYRYIPGQGVVYGDQQYDTEYDEPEMTFQGDSMLELITDYIERKEQA